MLSDEQIKQWMAEHLDEYYDAKTGLYDIGQLVLDAADNFNEWDDDGNPPERYYKLVEEVWI